MNTKDMLARLKGQEGKDRTAMLKALGLPLHVVDDIERGKGVPEVTFNKVSDWMLGNYVRDHVSGEWRLHKLPTKTTSTPMARTAPYAKPSAARELDATTGNPSLGCQPAPKAIKNRRKLSLFGRATKATPLIIPQTPRV